MRTGWLTCVALALAAGCSRHHAVTGPPPPDDAAETAAVLSALSQSGWDSDSLYTWGDVAIDGTAPNAGVAVAPFAFRHEVHRVERGPVVQLLDRDPSGRPLRAEVMMCKYVKAEFELLVADSTPPRAILKPRGNDDWFRTIVLRRASAASAWGVDSVSSVDMLSDDKLLCDACHTSLTAVRLRNATAGFDTTIVPFTGVGAVAGIPLLPVGLVLDVDVTTALPNDAVFVENAGTWSRLPRSGAGYAATVTVAGGLRHLAVQALTDSSLVEGPHYSQSTLLVPYRGVVPN